MIPNPYSLPASLEHHRYFTDDITLLPVSTIWRTMRGQPSFVRTLAFTYLLARKALGKRLPANHATQYPPALTEITQAEVFDDATQAIADFDNDCHAAGMDHAGYFAPSWIGGKRGVLSVSINQRGIVWCTSTWFEILVRDSRVTRVVFACHSEAADGTELHTAADTPDDLYQQLIPPNVEVERVPITSNASEVIARHEARITNRTDLISLDPTSLISHLEQRSLAQVDFMVSKGFYSQLTQDEVQRLRNDKRS
ncbi:hypothetical protein [Aporhodopirellula aestuarii]|uniref:Uncharacterized protein n=1 Tax=Aporhodopirellula aestuarii TaxID=2950107 RepID=A0ABT0U669_9BACT|nr:hypothetical protein [Aporhodopirellula aestuarii]MCM2372393.1 hypothetical protein [Aporhodopirellula aestuarii]